MAWIRTIADAEATGRLKRSFEAAIARAGRVFEIVRVMGLAPATLDASMGMYRAVMHGPSGPNGLDRRQREMLAVVVSAVNDCHY